MSENTSTTPAGPQKWGNTLAWDWIKWYVAAHIGAGIGVWYLIEKPTIALFGVTISEYSSLTVWLAFAQFYFCQLCTTCGAHRLFWHHSYEAKLWVQRTFAAGFSGVWQGPLTFWCPKHGDHHRRSDKKGDPHSPWLHGDTAWGRVVGFWWSHMGWVCTKIGISAPSTPSIILAVRDERCGPTVTWESDKHAELAGAYFQLPLIIGVLQTDLLGAVAVGVCLRVVTNYHLTWIVNSWGHTFGWRIGERKATNPHWYIAWFLGFLTAGEIYHAFHHESPKRWQLGTRWYDVDPGKWLIWLLMRLGQAWEVPPRQQTTTA